MSKMLILYRGETTTIASIREDFPALAEVLGVEINICELSKITSELIVNTDSIMLIRMTDPAVVELIKKVRKSGVFVIAYYDDDLLNLPDSFPRIEFQIRAMKNILRYSDAVLTANPKLQEKYKMLSSERCYLMHTAVPDDTIRRIPRWEREENRFSIVYAGGNRHTSDIEKYIVPFLKKLGEKYGKRIKIEFVGVKPKIDGDYGMEIKFTDGMPITQYREYMRRGKYDLGLAVLETDSFSECKYFNKYIEYTIVGTVGLYSDCKPYTYAIIDGENGFLVQNDPELWFKKICYIIENRDVLEQCKLNAIKQLEEKHSINCIADSLRRDLPEIVQNRIHQGEISLSSYRIIDRFYSLVTRICLYKWHLKTEGFSWIARSAKVKLSR